MGIRFSLREHKLYAAYNPDVSFIKQTATIVRAASTSAGMGKSYIFVVCDRAWLNGKYIRFNWEGGSSYSDPEALHIAKIHDGEYVRSSDTDFPSGSEIPTKGNGLLQTLASHGSIFANETQDVLVNVSGGNQTKCTIFFETRDPWNGQSIWLQIDWLEVNTGSGGAGNLKSEHFTASVTMEVTGTYGDYGYISTDSDVLSMTKAVNNTVSSAWTNPNNAFTLDSVCTSCNVNGAVNIYNFINNPFTIPSAATINGFEVKVYRACITNDKYNLELKDPTTFRLKNGTAGGVGSCANRTLETLGSPTDLWGGTWTPDHVNSSSFQVRLTQVKATAQDTTYVDYIEVTVYYTAPAAQPKRSWGSMIS